MRSQLRIPRRISFLTGRTLPLLLSVSRERNPGIRDSPEDFGTGEWSVQEESNLDLADEVPSVRSVHPVWLHAPELGTRRRGTQSESLEHGCDVSLSCWSHRRGVTAEEVPQVERYEAEVVV
jgi:hypothetical protein